MTQELVNQQTGEILPDPMTQKLVFGTVEPSGIIQRATDIANKLTPIIDNAKLYREIGGKKHVYAEGWTTMAALLGVFPSTVYARRIEREGEIVYEAKVVLRHLSGYEVGAGEAICSSRERNWSNRDEYAIKSMAQTRAVGKACRLSFSWIMALAGYAAAPAEEMVDAKPSIKPPRTTAQPIETEIEFQGPKEKPKTGKISDKQRALLFARWKKVGYDEEALKKHLKSKYNVEHSADLHYTQLNEILTMLDGYEQENG